MTEGRFEKGRWVEEQTGEFHSDERLDLENRLGAAKITFEKGLNEIVTVGHELLTTDEGRRYIGKTMDSTCSEIMEKLESTAKKATDFISELIDQKRK